MAADRHRVKLRKLKLYIRKRIPPFKLRKYLAATIVQLKTILQNLIPRKTSVVYHRVVSLIHLSDPLNHMTLHVLNNKSDSAKRRDFLFRCRRYQSSHHSKYSFFSKLAFKGSVLFAAIVVSIQTDFRYSLTLTPQFWRYSFIQVKTVGSLIWQVIEFGFTVFLW